MPSIFKKSLSLVQDIDLQCHALYFVISLFFKKSKTKNSTPLQEVQSKESVE